MSLDEVRNLNPQEWFGGIDVYLFDQLLKGRLHTGMRVLDAGCGGGRNLVYFLRAGYEVFGVDQSAEAVARVRSLADSLAPGLPSDNFRVEPVERMSFADASFELVISSAVLHFAEDEEHWHSMLAEMWRVLKPGGIFFARLATIKGVEREAVPLGGRRFRLPDGTDRFLVDDELLLAAGDSLGGELAEPLKTVVVHNQRSMGVWCLRKV